MYLTNPESMQGQFLRGELTLEFLSPRLVAIEKIK